MAVVGARQGRASKTTIILLCCCFLASNTRQPTLNEWNVRLVVVDDCSLPLHPTHIIIKQRRRMIGMGSQSWVHFGTTATNKHTQRSFVPCGQRLITLLRGGFWRQTTTTHISCVCCAGAPQLIFDEAPFSSRHLLDVRT